MGLRETEQVPFWVEYLCDKCGDRVHFCHERPSGTQVHYCQGCGEEYFLDSRHPRREYRPRKTTED